VGIELTLFDASLSEPTFEQVAFDLKHQGYSIQLNAVDPVLAQSLWREVSELSDDWFHRAGIGRANDYQLNRFN